MARNQYSQNYETQNYGNDRSSRSGGYSSDYDDDMTMAISRSWRSLKCRIMTTPAAAVGQSYGRSG